ncbi:MAG: response regulator [Thermoplasmata archaeon]
MKVIFVDDDSGFLDQAKFVLEKNDPKMDVVPIQSGNEALEYLEENEADIVVSDYKMPEMDGLELLKKLREKDHEMPFIIFTGKGREEIAMKALNLGADRYFRKGGDPMAQYEMLAQAINQEVTHYRTKKSHKNIESKLKRSEQKYRSVFQNIGLAMVTLKKDGTISLANSKFENLSRYSRDELEGKRNWFRFVSDEDKERVKKYHDLRNVDESMAPSSYEFRLVDKVNKEKYVLATLSKIPDEDETILTLYDFTEFEQTIQEFKNLEEAFKDKDLDEVESEIINSIEELFTKEGIKTAIKDWCLDELILLLIKSEDGATGKELMSGLKDLFGINLSSSIVYPRLHDLQDDGVLSINERIRSKEYVFKDEKKADEMINRKLKQLFGIYGIMKLLRSKVNRRE